MDYLTLQTSNIVDMHDMHLYLITHCTYSHLYTPSVLTDQIIIINYAPPTDE